MAVIKEPLTWDYQIFISISHKTHAQLQEYEAYISYGEKI